MVTVGFLWVWPRSGRTPRGLPMDGGVRRLYHCVMEVIKGAHSLYRLQYHVVWATKYRWRILKSFVQSHYRTLRERAEFQGQIAPMQEYQVEIQLILKCLLPPISRIFDVMNQALNHWLNTMRQDLEAIGIKTTVVDGQQKNSYGINLDSKEFVGGVFYWPENTYEVQFNDCNSGEVILLDTVNFDEPKLLEKYLNQVVFKKLSGRLK